MQLAYPIMLGQVGHIITGIADSIMVGNISASHLAASSLGHSIYIIFFIIGLGIATGITPLVGISYGEKNYKECGEYFKNGLISVLFIGILLMFIMILTVPLLQFLGQPPEVIDLAKPYYLISAYSLPFSILFVIMKQFTEGVGITKPAMVSSIVFNLLNILLNYLLIYGNFGFPRLELEGAAWATFISRVGMGFSLIIYVYYSDKFKLYLKKINWKKYSINHIKRIMTLGLPISMQFLLEVASFSMGAIMCGWVSSLALASHQIAISIAGFTYLAASGIGSAATIMVSKLKGERNYRELNDSANASFILVLIWMSICAVLIIVFRYIIAGFYVVETEVINLSANLLIIAAFFQLFDGLQVTALGALRGIEDVKIPTIAALISYWIISLPIGYFVGIYLGYGAEGVWFGFLIGLISAAILLIYRFKYLIKKEYSF
jgi:MATE family multidrug resistance protein